MKKLFALLMIFSFLLSSCAFDIELQTPSATPDTLSQTPIPLAGDLGWGQIHGRITDATTGTPIAGAIVTCEHHSYTSPATCSGTVKTDAEGIYIFENVFFHDTDTIKLTIQATGYQPQEITQSSFTLNDMERNFPLAQTP
jgi:hypothetical protein